MKWRARNIQLYYFFAPARDRTRRFSLDDQLSVIVNELNFIQFFLYLCIHIARESILKFFVSRLSHRNAMFERIRIILNNSFSSISK